MSNNHKEIDDIYICEYCGSEHDGSYGSGRFCSSSCSRRYSNTFVTEEGRKNQIATLNDPEIREKGYETHRKKNFEKNEAGYSSVNRGAIKADSKYKNKQPAVGKIGEVATIKKLIERDIDVYVPVLDNGVDIVANFGGKLQKIQVKSSTRSDDDKVIFSLTRNKNIIKGSTVQTQHQQYNTDEVDYFSLYDFSKDQVYLIENDRPRHDVVLRFGDTKNGQIAKINHSADFEIDRVLDELENGIKLSDVIDVEYTTINEDDDA